FLLLALGPSLGHLLLVFLFLAFSFFKLLLNALLFLRRLFGRQWHTVLADQLLHRFAIRQWIDFVNFYRLFLQYTFVVDLSIGFSLPERVFCYTVVDLVLIGNDFPPQCGDVEVLTRCGRIENAIVDSRVVLDGLQQQRQLAGTIEVHANTMRLEDATLGAVVIKQDARLFHVARDLREQRRLHAEVILKSRAATR